MTFEKRALSPWNGQGRLGPTPGARAPCEPQTCVRYGGASGQTANMLGQKSAQREQTQHVLYKYYYTRRLLSVHDISQSDQLVYMIGRHSPGMEGR